MSFEIFDKDILFAQRILKAAGLYKGPLDGVAGPLTTAAMQSFLSIGERNSEIYGKFDRRSEQMIITLLPAVQVLCRKTLRILINSGFEVKVLSGSRSYRKQEGIFAQGRSKEGKIVTNARPGQSNHNFGIAWDIGLFSGSAYLTSSEIYIRAGRKILGTPGLAEEIQWGGDWATFRDYPHYQLKLNRTIEAIREDFESGGNYMT